MNTELSESFYLALIAAFGGLITVIFNSVRKSRCTSLNCCGISCVRELLSEKATLEEIKTEQSTPQNNL
jgi:hypothetical protein